MQDLMQCANYLSTFQAQPKTHMGKTSKWGACKVQLLFVMMAIMMNLFDQIDLSNSICMDDQLTPSGNVVVEYMFSLS